MNTAEELADAAKDGQLHFKKIYSNKLPNMLEYPPPVFGFYLMQHSTPFASGVFNLEPTEEYEGFFSQTYKELFATPVALGELNAK